MDHRQNSPMQDGNPLESALTSNWWFHILVAIPFVPNSLKNNFGSSLLLIRYCLGHRWRKPVLPCYCTHANHCVPDYDNTRVSCLPDASNATVIKIVVVFEAKQTECPRSERELEQERREQHARESEEAAMQRSSLSLSFPPSTAQIL
jgi:hypothetical protein